MTDVLADIVAWKKAEVAARARETLAPRTRPLRTGWFRAALKAPRPDGTIRVIAEVKARSPSRGVLKPGLDHAALAVQYEAAGADALSVLADERYFGGSVDIVRRIAAASALPVLYKDVVVDPWQLAAAASAGADAVLLMVRVLDASLRPFLDEAAALGLDALVETHSAAEIEAALAAGALAVGVNARDLATFEEDLGLVTRLAGLLPREILKVGESAVASAADAARLREAGMDAVLVGEALVRAGDVAAALAALAGRQRDGDRA